MIRQRLMSWLLVVQPDPVQADALCNALRGNVSEDIVVAESLDAALSLIDEKVPDVILLPSLMPAAVEDYVVAYLGATPGADHVQILGLPALRQPLEPVPQKRTALGACQDWISRSIIPWWRRQELHHEPPSVDASGYDSRAFTKDVIDYLAGAKLVKKEMALYGASASEKLERRSAPRFQSYEVPWISLVSFAGEHATLLDVSARGARLRTSSRPAYELLKRLDSDDRSRAKLVLKLESHSEFQAAGQVIRCVPVRSSQLPQFDVVFSFDEAVGLHLPWSGENVPSLAAPKALFGSARAVAAGDGGGSLTVIATALIETGSRMDDVIFEEFKGTGNAELRLIRELADRRIYPAVDVAASGTRREELLADAKTVAAKHALRRGLVGLPPERGMEALLQQLRRIKTNAELLA